MLIDSNNRTIDYLRISVTQNCNFRCRYCMPNTPKDWTPKENLLSFDELFLFIKITIDHGVKKIRITGGEPLLRQNLWELIEKISNYAPSIDLALTTNGYFLPQFAKKLQNAGLKRVNISLDTLNHSKANFIAQKDVLTNVLNGIEEAIKVGLEVKLNTVAIKNFNEDEIIDILEFAKSRSIMVRFIEFMENINAKQEIVGLKSKDILNIIEKKYKVSQVQKLQLAPSNLYITDDNYKFGIIAPHGDEFCKSCNRIRLSAEGFLIPCLYFEDALSIRKAVKKGDINAAVDILKNVLKNKPEKNRWGEKYSEISTRAFYKTGG